MIQLGAVVAFIGASVVAYVGAWAVDIYRTIHPKKVEDK